MALLTLNNCLKTMNKSFVLFVIKSWSQIQNLTIVRAERGIFLKFKQNVRVWQNPKFLWRLSHSDVCLLWRLALWCLSSLTFVTLMFVHSDVCLSDVCPSTCVCIMYACLYVYLSISYMICALLLCYDKNVKKALSTCCMCF